MNESSSALVLVRTMFKVIRSTVLPVLQINIYKDLQLDNSDKKQSIRPCLRPLLFSHGIHSIFFSPFIFNVHDGEEKRQRRQRRSE